MLVWEFYTRLAYYLDKQKERAVEYQILAAIALNPHTKKPKAPDRLIRIPGQGSTMSKEDVQKDVEYKMRLYRHGKRTEC